MEKQKREEKQAALLGVRVGATFLVAAGILVCAAYFVLSQNFQRQLTDYTLQLVQSMVNQGVSTVEYELRTSREQAAALADAFSIPAAGQAPAFPAVHSQAEVLRTVYVTEAGAAASDGRRDDIRARPDVQAAFAGETAMYGPYFNEHQEYVVCYSAPVVRDGAVAGVLSVEKDGYYFCSLIESIRFVDTGESYIIDAEGTDIAVSDPNHLSWVNDRYNARRLLEAGEDPVTRAILELEQKGLDGETGMGTYTWDGGLCHLVYAPIPSVNWVLLAGLREEELAAMMRSTLYTSLADSPLLLGCVAVFLVLTAMIVFWIVSSLQKSAEINEKLNVLANYDALTGAQNRNGFHTALDTLSAAGRRCFACVYVDANGLHELNNHLGHEAGDKMLKAVAEALRRQFSQNGLYRIGGDEFVVFCQDLDRQAVERRMALVREALKAQGYEISVGIDWRAQGIDVKAMVSCAEDRMQQDKRRYYQENGKGRQVRALDDQLERLLLEKQDADTFLSVLEPLYTGVYFVDLASDTIRHLYLPPYFAELLEEADDVFSQALRLYAARLVAPACRQAFLAFCDYKTLEPLLQSGASPELAYQKTDGAWVRVQILKFKAYGGQSKETLWIFSNLDAPPAAPAEA